MSSGDEQISLGLFIEVLEDIGGAIVNSNDSPGGAGVINFTCQALIVNIDHQQSFVDVPDPEFLFGHFVLDEHEFRNGLCRLTTFLLEGGEKLDVEKVAGFSPRWVATVGRGVFFLARTLFLLANLVPTVLVAQDRQLHLRIVLVINQSPYSAYPVVFATPSCERVIRVDAGRENDCC